MFYDKPKNKPLLAQDIELARSYGIKLSDEKLQEFMTELLTRRYADLHAYHERERSLDSFD